LSVVSFGLWVFFVLACRPRPPSSLFPYTTLFRSIVVLGLAGVGAVDNLKAKDNHRIALAAHALGINRADSGQMPTLGDVRRGVSRNRRRSELAARHEVRDAKGHARIGDRSRLSCRGRSLAGSRKGLLLFGLGGKGVDSVSHFSRSFW